MEKILIPIFDRIKDYLDAIDQDKSNNENEFDSDIGTGDLT
jgi:hypothetical protein